MPKMIKGTLKAELPPRLFPMHIEEVRCVHSSDEFRETGRSEGMHRISFMF
jgi:hypothetical protein